MRLRTIISALLGIFIVMFSLGLEYSVRKVNAQTSRLRQSLVIVDVVLYDFGDNYISLVKQSLEDIQKQNVGKVKFNIYDRKGNQAIQNEILDNLSKKNQDILLVNLVDSGATHEVIERFRQRGIPVVFFNREPLSIDAIKSYEKAYYVGTDARESGELQAQILINLWNNNRAAIDVNNNGGLQYIILRGQQNNIEAQNRTESVISTLEKSGIKTASLASSVSNWDSELDRISISSLFLQHDTRIEAVIANNDEMAIGAIEALQKYGYNLGDPKKTIVVVGIDAIPEAQELIKKRFMAGSVIQDPTEMAKAIYLIGLNVFEGKKPLEGTQYKFDETGIALRLPYKKYTG